MTPWGLPSAPRAPEALGAKHCRGARGADIVGFDYGSLGGVGWALRWAVGTQLGGF